jgi:hypothetical protein
MLIEEFLHRFTGLVACTILDQDKIFIGLIENLSKKLGIRVRGESFILKFEEESSGKVLYLVGYLG